MTLPACLIVKVALKSVSILVLVEMIVLMVVKTAIRRFVSVESQKKIQNLLNASKGF